MNEILPLLTMPALPKEDASYDVTLEVTTPINDSLLEKLREMVEYFAEAGCRGGYVASMAQPHESRLTMIAHSTDISGNFSCTFEAKYIDLNAFQLLRNLAARLKLADIYIERITVKEIGGKNDKLIELPVPNEENEFAVYPKISTRIGFETEGEDSDFSKVRRCLVEMLNPVDSVQVHAVKKWIEPWYYLIESGAFSMPISLPEESDSIAGLVTLFDECSIEISIDRFLTSETAWNVLINLLDFHSNTSDPIVKVYID